MGYTSYGEDIRERHDLAWVERQDRERPQVALAAVAADLVHPAVRPAIQEVLDLLDLVTTPELNLAREVLGLRKELAAYQQREREQARREAEREAHFRDELKRERRLRRRAEASAEALACQRLDAVEAAYPLLGRLRQMHGFSQWWPV